ncbi:MAG TPA: NAD(P)H-hydrate dehydratase [Allosphingosinicella sp.]|uniref:NAD(P)H-hydrate dehydratase n=1 Tax=Allosphingosinicella sp. TaxID=2823234 RepID=UPI002ED809BF
MKEPRAVDADLLKRFPLPRHPDDAGKEDRGRLLVVAGSRELPGAALLAGTAGLRAGCGKLQIATAASIAVQLGIAVPEARVIPHRETEEGCIDESEIAPLLKWAKGAQAMLLGCGLQQGAPLEKLLDALLASGIDIPLVLDAAVLSKLAHRAEPLKAWQGGAVILPHAGEMASLLGREREEVEAEPLAAARNASERLGVTAVIKGEYSFIVSPDGEAFRYRGGGVGLATSGSGDVLAGIVGGLCARGADPLTAALWGVHLHGEAGRKLSASVGRVGFLARELVDLVPRIMGGGA